MQPANLFNSIVPAIATLACTGILLNAQGKGKCTNQPLRMELKSSATLSDGVTTVPSAVTGDGNWYTDGPGVGALIHYCSGTYDAVLNLPQGKRMLTFTFPSPIPGSYVDEQIPAGAYQRNGLINVRNLICSGCGVDPHQPFTARVVMQIFPLVNGHDFSLQYMPLVVDAPDLHTSPPNLPEANVPYSSSPALVIPLPYDCLTGGSVKPAWLVRGTVPNNDPATPAGFGLQVGTAHSMLRSGNVRAGQYSMPFELRIEALQCFSF